MKAFTFGILLISLVTIASCGARRNQVIIDPVGVDMAIYQRDLQICTQIAEQVEDKTGKNVVGGALIGALIGAAVGNSDTAKKIAGVGAIKGGLDGNSETKQERLVVIKNCMRGRGYNVLN